MIEIKTFVFFLFYVGKSIHAIEHYKWMYYLPYGSTVHLQPLFNGTECQPASQCYWLLPDQKTRLNYPLIDSIDPRYSFAFNGTLTIQNIQAEDNGIYHFFRLNQTKWIVSKALLNIKGAPYPSLWAEYWPNVVGSLVAMAVVFITFGLILLADKYRYRAPPKISVRSSKITPQSTDAAAARTNPVFVNDETSIKDELKRKSSRRSSTTSNGTNLCVEQF